jgi:hypothetical protein
VRGDILGNDPVSDRSRIGPREKLNYGEVALKASDRTLGSSEVVLTLGKGARHLDSLEAG